MNVIKNTGENWSVLGRIEKMELEGIVRRNKRMEVRMRGGEGKEEKEGGADPEEGNRGKLSAVTKGDCQVLVPAMVR
jgi:hypothetical protein